MAETIVMFWFRKVCLCALETVIDVNCARIFVSNRKGCWATVDILWQGRNDFYYTAVVIDWRMTVVYDALEMTDLDWCIADYGASLSSIDCASVVVVYVIDDVRTGFVVVEVVDLGCLTVKHGHRKIICDVLFVCFIAIFDIFSRYEAVSLSAIREGSGWLNGSFGVFAGVGYGIRCSNLCGSTSEIVIDFDSTL